VQAKTSGNELEILVVDDGKGFDPASPLKRQRNGLGNMHRRAEAVSGTPDLQSKSGGGTTVRLVVKLKN
jgi:signal transduction histidine kinase